MTSIQGHFAEAPEVYRHSRAWSTVWRSGSSPVKFHTKGRDWTASGSAGWWCSPVGKENMGGPPVGSLAKRGGRHFV